MNDGCPQHGDSSLFQITPGYFECRSPVVVAVIQRPDGMGPMPAEHPCGYRFQVQVAGPAELCRCGRHSIGRCADCDRPLCGIDGTRAGLFLCPECISQRDQKRRAEEEAAAEQQQAAAARELAEAQSRRTAAVTELAAARSVDELIRVIVANAADIPNGAAKAAWLQIVSSKVIAPTHEIVKAIGLRHILYDFADPGRDWREVSRAEAWQAQGLMAGDGSGTSDRWLAHDGSMWTAAGSQDLRLYEKGTPQAYPFGRRALGEPNWIAIPTGEVFRTSFRSARDQHNPSDRNSPSSYVPGGVRLSLQTANGNYAKIAAAILCTR
jgi:hypothetical protein